MGKIAVFFRLIFSIVLGFLPSFVFIWIFIRSGSPFSNYINFLSNFETSKWAWVLATIIAFLIFIIWNIAKSKSSSKKYVLAVIIFFLLIGGVLVFAQAYMYIKFFLGGDTLVQLSANKENIFFGDKTEESVSFETSVVLTPLCSAECSYEFFDLTRGEMIERGDFTINPVLSKTKTFSLKKEDIINGQTLKKFKVACKSKKTKLCYTLEKENQKEILITVNYGLTKEQKDLMESLKSEILLLGGELYLVGIQLREDEANLINIDKIMIIDNLSNDYNNLSKSYSELNSLFEMVKISFENQNFLLLNDSLNKFKTRFVTFKLEETQFSTNITSKIDIYNQLIENIGISKELIQESLKRNLIESNCNELQSIIKEFNIAILTLKTWSDISYKKSKVDEVYLRASELNKNSEEDAGSPCNLDENITQESIIKIEQMVINEPTPNISLRESDSECC